MKEKITLLFLLFSLSFFAQEEFLTHYEIQYEVEYSLDSTDLDNKTKETVYLYTGAETGVFMNFNFAHQEEIEADYEEQMRKQRGLSTTSYRDNISRPTNFKILFFKDLKSDSILTVAALAYHQFLYQEPEIPQWELQDSTKTYEKYLVQKAKTHFAGRDYTAWFSPEIPIPDGPYVFKGLPGLIVELYDSQNHYHFKLLSVEKLEKPKKWNFPENLKNTTKEEFLKHREKEIELEVEDLFGLKGDETKIIVTVKGREVSKGEYRKILRDRKRKKNNPIEIH